MIVCSSASKAESAEAHLKSLLLTNRPSTIGTQNLSSRVKVDRVKIILATGSTDDKQKAVRILLN